MIKIIEGNLFDTKANIICHQANAQGIMGSGVALQVKQLYPKVYLSYKKDYDNGLLKLGYVNFCSNGKNQLIANMIGQEKYGYDGSKYTNYDKLQECFDKVVFCAYNEFDKKPIIAFPYLMSCHRGGGDWNIVYDMIEKIFNDFDVEIWRMNNV